MSNYVLVVEINADIDANAHEREFVPMEGHQIEYRIGDRGELVIEQIYYSTDGFSSRLCDHKATVMINSTEWKAVRWEKGCPLKAVS
jgi:hypothetical protein